MFNNNEIDIVHEIKLIEKLKCVLLSKVSDLIYTMSEADRPQELVVQLLSDINMLSYMLANRLGSSYQLVDLKMMDKLKLELKETDDEEWEEMITSLIRHIMSQRKVCD